MVQEINHFKKSYKRNNPLGGVVVLEGKEINNYSSKDFAKQMSVVLTEKVKKNF